MSASRRSFPGIAQAWIARGNGKQIPNFIDAKSLSVLCDIDFIGDTPITHTLAVMCEIIEPPPNFTQTMVLVCGFQFTGDVNPVHDLDVICDTTFLGDVNPSVDMTGVVVVIGVSGP